MFHAEWIEYLKRENGSKYFDQIKNHYMPRKLKRFTQINRKILDTTNDNFIIVHAEEDYKEQLRQMSEMKSVHYLIKNGKQKRCKSSFMAKVKWITIETQ